MNTKTGFYPADILLPDLSVDYEKWSVIACDQYTSQRQYWEKVREVVDDSPSALHLIYPEAYLEDGDGAARIAQINRTMREYAAGGLLCRRPNAMIYVERTMRDGRVRRGLVGAVDLEEYDYRRGAQSRIRATEQTVVERIPPRVKIRQDAILEIPHIMLLVDDPEKTVIEPLCAQKPGMEKLYDFTLMLHAGRVAGYLLPDDAAGQVQQALERLSDPEAFRRKYGVDTEDVMLFAAGDGNHSLATAKECYEQAKAQTPPDKWAELPSRYALVELVNLHDDSLQFEPIHRVVFGCGAERLLQALEAFCGGYERARRPGVSARVVQGAAEEDIVPVGQGDRLPVAVWQEFLDVFAKESGCKVDYIHGDDAVRQLCADGENTGLLLPPMEKSDLFRTVITEGALPRKTFSMGHADDKRFYLEARKIQ